MSANEHLRNAVAALMQRSEIVSLTIDHSANVATIVQQEICTWDVTLSADDDGVLHESASDDNWKTSNNTTYDDLAEYVAWLEEGL